MSGHGACTPETNTSPTLFSYSEAAPGSPLHRFRNTPTMLIRQLYGTCISVSEDPRVWNLVHRIEGEGGMTVDLRVRRLVSEEDLDEEDEQESDRDVRQGPQEVAHQEIGRDLDQESGEDSDRDPGWDSGDSTEQDSDDSTVRSPSQVSDQSPFQSFEQAADRIGDQDPGEIIHPTPDQAVDDPGDRVGDQGPGQIIRQVSDQVLDELLDIALGRRSPGEWEQLFSPEEERFFDSIDWDRFLDHQVAQLAGRPLGELPDLPPAQAPYLTPNQYTNAFYGVDFNLPENRTMLEFLDWEVRHAPPLAANNWNDNHVVFRFEERGLEFEIRVRGDRVEDVATSGGEFRESTLVADTRDGETDVDIDVWGID
ncbi:hypothetical protein K458DRAFT_390768 [Lentithecium fluviatile CBS 122367]|uniref:Uncharacterized protein n=1 Tax=Lentithecium fluviatile CBS 122367 TaxID=1168545 RepID=A0A6G1IX89_9PLEO|nr:hypothetical protein K458DRAFT_390768 [Lentithecium fluviatile CBS 122367]